MIREIATNAGKTVHELSLERPVLLIFLRHFGCVFCKEALHDIAEIKDEIKDQGIELVFVHMAENHIAEEYFHKFKLEGVQHISNPEKNLYVNFGLMKGTFSQLYGLRTWIRGYGAKSNGYQLEMTEQLGDSTQMPGMFLISDGNIAKSFIHKRASERPDYEAFLSKAMEIA